MRNRSDIKIFVLLALVLFLSVGYAVVSSVSLSITGAVSAGTSELRVSFTGDKTISNPSKGSATVTAGSKTATFTASNMTLNETITFTLPIKNNETDVHADVSLTTTGSNSYFTISVSQSSFQIATGSTQNVVVTVKMIKTPVTSADSSATLKVSITALPIECCFDPGTKILMADGNLKNIEDVKVGDMVMSLNEDTGEYIAQRVKNTIIKENSDDLVYVYLSNGTRLGMRAYHPLLTTEGWKSLRPELAETIMDVGKVPMLDIGDVLVGYGENAKVVSIVRRMTVKDYNTYNLSVEGYPNYIAEGMVVHNTPCMT